MKISELIDYGKKLLKENNIDDYSIIAKELACFIFELDRNNLILNMDKEVNEKDKARFYLALIELVQGMPIQYITNKQEFMGIDFYVDENVLIPQPDTEILVEEVLEIVSKKSEPLYILDLCTGSGAIGISIAKNTKNSKVVLSDISEKSIEVAKKNSENSDIMDKVKFIKSDLFEDIQYKFDIIVSNPPYIKTDIIKTLPKDVQKEPIIALDGGKDGLDFYKRIIGEAKGYLNNGGYLCLEIGYDQKEEVEKILKAFDYNNIYCKKDLSGNDRVIIANI